MAQLVHLVAGLVFGLGLVISGMVDPAKVQNFLDVAGAWDPSLAFVMGGGLAVALLGYRLIFRRGRPLFAPRFELPANRRIDRRLLSGAAIFGLGWGLSGLCPGPAVTALGLAAPGTLVFLAAMLGGMVLARRMG